MSMKPIQKLNEKTPIDEITTTLRVDTGGRLVIPASVKRSMGIVPDMMVQVTLKVIGERPQ